MKLTALLLILLFLWLCHCIQIDREEFLRNIRQFKRNKAMIPQNCPLNPPPIELEDPLPFPIVRAFQDLDKMLESKFKETAKINPGMISAVVFNDSIIWSKGYGTKNIDTPNDAPDVNTIFRIGSVTKLFPSIMMFKLYESGKLESIDVPVHKVNKDFKPINPYKNQPLRFRQIASQLSGLQEESPCNRECKHTTAEIFARLAEQELISPVYFFPSYSNFGFSILGRVLSEDVAGEMFEDWTHKNILSTLQMNSTGFTFTNNVIGKMAVGYEEDGKIAPLVNVTIFNNFLTNYKSKVGKNWDNPNGQCYSSAADMGKMLSFLMVEEKYDEVLSFELRKEMLLPTFINSDGVTGFGMPYENYFRDTYLIRTKTGGVPGYTSIVCAIPELKLGFISMWNGEQVPVRTYQDSVFDILIPTFKNYFITNAPPLPQPTNQTKPLYLGNYRLDGITQAQISMKDDSLYLNAEGIGSGYLSFISDTLFRIQIPTASMSCMDIAFEALNNEFVRFAFNGDKSKVLSFTFPGITYNVFYTKV